MSIPASILILSAAPGALPALLDARGLPWRATAEPVGPDDVSAADLVVSYGYRHILRKPVLDAAREVVNLHISLLPWNRGADPNVWSFLDGTPAGVTIHRVDPGLDTGPVFARAEVLFDPATETLASSYAVLHARILALFDALLPDLLAGRLTPAPQPEGGSSHRAAAFASVRDRLLGPEGWDVPIPRLLARWRSEAEAGKGGH